MSALSDFNGNGAMVGLDDSSTYHDNVEGDLIVRSKKDSLILLLYNHLEEFNKVSRAETTSGSSQHQQILQRQLTTKILKSIQDLLLLPLTTSFRDYRKSPLSAVDEIISAVLILVDEWEVGDGRLRTALVDALIRSVAAAAVPSHDRLQGLESFQNFVLLDLLPHVINDDTENCHRAQSIVAKSLVQIICSSCGNVALTSPSINWCRWQLDNIYLRHQCSSLRNFSLIGSEPRRFMLPPEVQELGLVLLRSAHSPHLLPSACRIAFDHVSVLATCNAICTTLLLKHASDTVSVLRQRLIDFASMRSQPTSNFEAREEESKCQENRQKDHCLWQLQLAQVVVMALSDEAAHQSELLKTAYLQQVIGTLENTSQARVIMMKRGKDCDLNGLCENAYQCKSDVIHPQLLTLDWIVLSFLVSKSPASTKQSSPLFEICNSICEFEQCSKNCCPFSVYRSLSTAMEVVLHQYHDGGMEQLYAPPVTCEESTAGSVCHTLEHESMRQELVSGLLSLDVVLLLSSTRAVASRIVQLMRPVAIIDISVSSAMSVDKLFRFSAKKILTTSWVHDLTVHLYELLDARRQEEFIAMLFHLVDETSLRQKCFTSPDCGSDSSFSRGPSTRKRKMTSFSGHYLGDVVNAERESEKTVVIRLVYSILLCLAEKSPKSFLCFKNELVQRLLQPTFDEETPLCNDVVRPICKILVSLLSIPEHFCSSASNQRLNYSDVLLLIQKLLFGEPARLGTSRVVRGIALATEILETRSSNTTSMDSRNCIQDWVAQCLLPSTRRMVDPEIGLSGLLFLQSWIDKNESSDEKMTNAIVFHHFKMIIANTGLIQMVDTYQASGNKTPSSLLGYSPSVESIHSTGKESSDRDRPLARAMLFGICFFLRHAGNIESCPGRWSVTTDWVYSLVDTYLHIGRTTASKNWHPNNWILASLEFPLMSTLCFKRSVNAQSLVLEWISEKLCRFDISDGIQPVNFFPAAHSDTVVRCLSSKALRQLIDSANCLSLALLIGISLSAAVLRNAFDHALSLDTNSRRFPPLLKVQLAKIYDLRAKSSTMDSFLTAMASALRRSSLRKKRATVVLSDDSCDDYGAAVPVASVRNIQVCQTISHVSDTRDF
jgi:hypothetical protein